MCISRKFTVAIGMVFVLLLAASSGSIWAQPALPQDQDAATTQAPRARSDDWSRDFFAVGGGHIVESSPILADVDGDGQQEILVGTTAEQGNPPSYTAPMRLIVMNPNGSIQWARDLDAPVRSSPAVGDLDGDGDMEVVVSVGGSVGNMDHQGGVLAYDHQGNRLWRFTTQDHHPRDGYADGVFSSPTLCDVDGDGDLEISFGSWDQRIYLLDHTGESLWNDRPGDWEGLGYYNADSIWSSAACADFNGDGNLEIVIGADITGNGILPDGTPTQDGGFLYVFTHSGDVLVRRFLPEAIYSSPAVGDLDGDGDLEITVGTSAYWWNQHGRQASNYVYAFDASALFGDRHYSDPAKLPHLAGWPQETDYPGFSSPALADLDGDGDLEIVIGTNHPDLDTGDNMPGAGSVYAWHHTGALVQGWPVRPTNALDMNSFVRSSPVVADVDNDGGLEVLFAMLWDVQIYNADGSFQELLDTTWTLVASPAVGDADGDGRIEVWIGGGNNDDQNQGYLWRFEASQSGVGERPWPMFQRDAQHTGRYPTPPDLAVSHDRAHLMHDPDRANLPWGKSTSLRLENRGGQSAAWEVSAVPSDVDVSPRSGELSAHAGVTLGVTVDPSGYRSGTHQLGDIRIRLVTEDGAAGDTLVVPVTLYVGDLHPVFVPLIQN